MACADCKIDTGDTIYVCASKECRTAHEQGPCTARRDKDGNVIGRPADLNNPKEVAAALGAESLGQFPDIVAKLSPEQRRECAAHFEVAVSTVDLWTKGSKFANPHPALKWQIIRWVTARLAS
jgi:hypothetical protein